jgi:hypothetical protein
MSKKSKLAAKEAADDGPSTSGRRWTVSMAVPGSIIDNTQNIEFATFVAGQVARTAAIFNVDEVVVFDDTADRDAATVSSGTAFLARVVQFMETPQYLRKALIPMHEHLRLAGLLPPLDAINHHLRTTEWRTYREGVVLKSEPGKGSYVDIGLDRMAFVQEVVAPSTRVTLHVGEELTAQFMPDFGENMILGAVGRCCCCFGGSGRGQGGLGGEGGVQGTGRAAGCVLRGCAVRCARRRACTAPAPPPPGMPQAQGAADAAQLPAVACGRRTSLRPRLRRPGCRLPAACRRHTAHTHTLDPVTPLAPLAGGQPPGATRAAGAVLGLHRAHRQGRAGPAAGLPLQGRLRPQGRHLGARRDHPLGGPQGDWREVAPGQGAQLLWLAPGLLQLPGLVPGLPQVPGLVPGLPQVPGLVPGLLQLPGLVPGLLQLPGLVPGLLQVPGLVPGLLQLPGLVPGLPQVPGLLTGLLQLPGLVPGLLQVHRAPGRDQQGPGRDQE